MKKGFTIVEVSILFVIFLIVAFLVAPLSLDDTKQAKNTSKWRNVQEEFVNIFDSLSNQSQVDKNALETALWQIVENEITDKIKPYKITYLNGTYPSNSYRFNDYRLTHSNAVVSIKLFDTPQNDVNGMIMYDVNGPQKPNSWGKDVFGYNIYKDKLKPFGAGKPLGTQKQDCSKNGTGLFCSNYYLIGGNFD